MCYEFISSKRKKKIRIFSFKISCAYKTFDNKSYQHFYNDRSQIKKAFILQRSLHNDACVGV